MARLVGLLMLSLLSACSPAAVLNALAPRAGISVTRDVAYAGGERRTLDTYAPAGQFGGHQDGGAAAEHSAPPPLEGGGWGEGSVEGGLWRRSFSWQGPLPPTQSLKGRGRRAIPSRVRTSGTPPENTPGNTPSRTPRTRPAPSH